MTMAKTLSRSQSAEFIRKIHRSQSSLKSTSERQPYDGQGSYTAPNGDWYPALSYKNTCLSVAFFIVILEFAERLSYYSISSILKPYLQSYFGYSSSSATAINSTFGNLIHLTPILGAFFADSYWGRYNTIAIGGAIYVVGITMIAVASYPFFNNLADLFLVGMFVFIVIGGGGIKPCVSSLGGDQFDKSTEKGMKGFTLYSETFLVSIECASIIAYLGVSGIAINGIPGLVPISSGYFTVFLIAAIALYVAYGSFMMGTPRYIKLVPEKSKISKVFSVLFSTGRETVEGVAVLFSMFALILVAIIAAINSFLSASDVRVVNYVVLALFLISFVIFLNVNDSNYIVNGYLNLKSKAQKRREAEVMVVDDGSITASDECDDLVVNVPEGDLIDIYVFARLFPFLVFYVFYWLIYYQSGGTFYSVTCQMNLANADGTQMNANAFTSIPAITISIFIPLMEMFGNSLVEKMKGSKFTMLQKFFVGLIIGAIAIISAAVIEIERKKAPLLDASISNNHSRCANLSVMSDFSVYWMVLPYILSGISMAFCSGPIYGFLYSQVPPSLRSLSIAVYYFTESLGGAIESLLVMISGELGIYTNNLNKGNLEYFFFFVAGIIFLNALIFAYSMRNFELLDDIVMPSLRKETDMDQRVEIEAQEFKSVTAAV